MVRYTADVIKRVADRMKERGSQIICRGHGDYTPDHDCALAARILSDLASPAVATEKTRLALFLKQLAALRDIDQDEIEVLNIPWRSFDMGRVTYLMNCSDHEAEMIWLQIENRTRE